MTIPKILWTLWLQGWNEAPDIVRASGLSWRRWNQNWDIRFLDLTHVKSLLPHYTPEGSSTGRLSNVVLSDLFRLELLRRHGGVWADATAYCLMPLDKWLDGGTPRGFFAFDRPGPDRMLSNWFLAAAVGSPVIAEWQNKAKEYWRDRSAPDTYFWMHYLFADLYHSNDECRRIWDETPKRSADGPHALVPYERTLPAPPTDRMRGLVEAAEVPLLKLTHKVDHALGNEGSTYRWLCDREFSHPNAAPPERWDGRF